MSLPGLLGRIAEIAGEAAALNLARELGGQELKISGRPGGKLARIVGDEAAAAIADAFGPEKITVPMAHLRGQKGRRAAAARMMAAGATVTQAARACDIHERTAWRARADEPQPLPLFPEPADEA
ncbi:MAG: helix-turn-helix domain-containing protein [Caulobacter sp.]